jgi:hypothetical protein
MNPLIFVAVDLIALYLLVQAIYTSSRRLVSLGYAVLGFGLVIGLGFGAMFILVPERGTLVETNSTLEMIGAAITIGAPFAAVWGASQPPRRDKA